jgi:DNA-binding HxlR family transcriptional regulator
VNLTVVDWSECVTLQGARSMLAAVELASSVLFGRWRCAILVLLFDRAMHFREIMAALPGLTAKVLAANLRILQRDGIVHRVPNCGARPRPSYELTALGRGLAGAITGLVTWGDALSRQDPSAPARHGVAQVGCR